MRQTITYDQKQLWDAVINDMGLTHAQTDSIEFVISKVRYPQPEIGEQGYLNLVTGVKVRLNEGVEVPVVAK